jgi:hypothetical protein
MTYKLKLSKKNQVTLPVGLLKAIHILPERNFSPAKTKSALENTQIPNYLTIAKNFQGRYEIVDPIAMIEELAGSVEAPEHLKGISDEKLEELIEQAKDEYFFEKWNKTLKSNK